jgi:hypothetical protein
MTPHMIAKGHAEYCKLLMTNQLSESYRGGKQEKGKRRKPRKNDLIYVHRKSL